jgi:hypothetical protein
VTRHHCREAAYDEHPGKHPADVHAAPLIGDIRSDNLGFETTAMVRLNLELTHQPFGGTG